MSLHRYEIATAASGTAPVFSARFERARVPEADAGGLVAPWWANVLIERVATADGLPLPKAFHEGYCRLFDVLAELEEDGEITPAAAGRSRQMLQRCMFAGAVPPKLSWHGGDAVVLMWSGDQVTSFFTIGAEGFSFLEERDGEITARCDDLAPLTWEAMFPVPMASTEAPDTPPQKLDQEVIVADGDLLARQIFYRTSFEDGVVSANALLQFQGNSNADGSFDESLFLTALSSPPEIHAVGCAAAAKQNERQRTKRIARGLEPDEPVPGDDRRYYCGFTHAAAGSLRLEGANYNVDLVPAEENGMKSHVAIFLRPKPGVAKLHMNDRTEAGRRLARCFHDPQPWVCPADEGDDEHPITKFGDQVLMMIDSAA